MTIAMMMKLITLYTNTRLVNKEVRKKKIEKILFLS